MLKVGITGGIGAGKTTVCKLFEMMGIPVYYADIESKKMLSSNLSVKSEVKKLLGEDSYFKNGKPNRAFMATLVFSDKSLLDQLNLIIHPAVKLHALRWFESLKKQFPYAIKEAALLVESGSYKELDVLIVVSSPNELRIERVMKRDKLPRNLVENRINNQLPEKAKITLADFVVQNDDQKLLIKQVWTIHNAILRMK